MNKDKRKHVQVGLGASSILMIFVVLCMMILSVLSYSKALQKEEIANQGKQVQKAYTQADATLQYVLHEMHHTLPLDEYSKKLLDTHKIIYDIKGNTLTLTYPVSEQRTLRAVIETGDTWIIKAYTTTGTGA